MLVKKANKLEHLLNPRMLSQLQDLELLHLDLFGPTKTQRLDGKKNGMVIVDDFSRHGWVLFLAHKDEAFSHFEKVYKKIQNKIQPLYLLEVIMEKNLKLIILSLL